MAEITDSSQRIGEDNNKEALKAEMFRRKPGLTKRRIIVCFLFFCLFILLKYNSLT